MTGKRGPASTPSNILKLRGSWRAEQRTNEPKVEPKIPWPPKWLPEECHRDFKATAKQLHVNKLIGDIDAEPLGRLVYLRARFKTSVEELEFEDNYAFTAKGELKVNAKLKALMDIATQIDRMERSFGITPSARVGLSTVMTKTDKKKGKLDDFRKTNTG